MPLWSGYLILYSGSLWFRLEESTTVVSLQGDIVDQDLADFEVRMHRASVETYSRESIAPPGSWFSGRLHDVSSFAVLVSHQGVLFMGHA